jgi:hypothetical protein
MVETPTYDQRAWISMAVAALACAGCGAQVSDTSKTAPGSLRITAHGSAVTEDIEIDAEPLAALPCPVNERVDGCCFAAAPGAASSVANDSSPRNFGTIVVSDRSNDTILLRLSFDPKPNGATGPARGYHPWESQPATWAPGDELGVTVNGTELSVVSPLSIHATTPVHDGFLDVGGDLTLGWTPDPHVSTMRVEYTTYETSAHVICDVPDSSGSLTIPAARLGLTSADGVSWPNGEITFTRVLSAVTPMRGSRDTLRFDARQQLDVFFESRRTCSADADCRHGLGCRCSLCMARQFCATDADCGAGSYCTSLGPVPGTNPPCSRGTCDTLPASITCGALDCPAHIMHFDPSTSLAIAPCCVPGADACGLDVSPLYIASDACQPLDQGHGAGDLSCPGCSGASCPTGSLAPCRRSDGKCGFALDDLGLGCVVDPLAP